MIQKKYSVFALPFSRYSPQANEIIHTPKIQFNFERGPYLVKVAETAGEIQSLFRLRRKVFQKEFKRKLFSLRSDREKFDDYADFLIIVDKKKSKVVGTYRLICDVSPEQYYTASEFNLGSLLQLPDKKLELSRACIHRKYRNGMVLHLLWRGVAEYGSRLGMRYLFGCASVISVDPVTIANMVVSLEKQGVLTHDFGISPLPNYTLNGLQPHCEILRTQEKIPLLANKTLPSLFRSYLKAGAKVFGYPAVDWAFRCVDFLTLLDLKNVNATHERKYLNDDKD